MPYVVRDENGCIVSVLAQPAKNGERWDGSDEDINEIFSAEDATKQLQEVLVASDLSFVRVLEDLIGVLLDKGVLMLTDLPEAAQQKVLQRKEIRDYISRLSGLVAEEKDEEILI